MRWHGCDPRVPNPSHNHGSHIQLDVSTETRAVDELRIGDTGTYRIGAAVGSEAIATPDEHVQRVRK